MYFSQIKEQVTIQLESFEDFLSPFLECHLVIRNVDELMRSYSSTFNADSPGEGYARSSLGSEQAWTAYSNFQGQFLVLDLGDVDKIVGIVTQGNFAL